MRTDQGDSKSAEKLFVFSLLIRISQMADGILEAKIDGKDNTPEIRSDLIWSHTLWSVISVSYRIVGIVKEFGELLLHPFRIRFDPLGGQMTLFILWKGHSSEKRIIWISKYINKNNKFFILEITQLQQFLSILS